jgi:hypothetical protein
MEEELIRIRWHVDRTQQPAVYMLICEDPAHADLQVSVTEEEMTETIREAILAKPKWHGELSYQERSHANRNMNQIGG